MLLNNISITVWNKMGRVKFLTKSLLAWRTSQMEKNKPEQSEGDKLRRYRIKEKNQLHVVGSTRVIIILIQMISFMEILKLSNYFICFLACLSSKIYPLFSLIYNSNGDQNRLSHYIANKYRWRERQVKGI